MNAYLIGREDLPPYSTQQWLIMTKGRDVVLYEIDTVPPLKFFHNKSQKTVLVLDKDNTIVSVVVLEIVPYKEINLEVASIAKLDMYRSVLLMYNTIRRDNAKVGVLSYVLGTNFIGIKSELTTNDIIPYLSLTHLNPDMFKLAHAIPTLSCKERFAELNKAGISLKAGFDSAEAMTLLVGIVDDINQLTENKIIMVPPVIDDARTEKIGICGSWAYSLKRIRLEHNLFNQRLRLCFYDEYEDAYCAVAFGAFSATLIKYENEDNLRFSVVDSYVKRDGNDIPKDVFNALLNDTCSNKLITCVKEINWSLIFDWIVSLC